jgi:transcriptional regulator
MSDSPGGQGPTVPAAEKVTRVAALASALGSAEPKTLSQLSAELHISEKDLPELLEKVQRGLKARGERLHTVAPYCLECGFEFEQRQRSRRPSRCPMCKSERICPARFSVRS